MRASRFAIVVACVLLGAVVGAVTGWASAPEHPAIVEGAWRMSSSGLVQRVVNRYMDVLAQFIIVGVLTGGVLGGAVGTACILLRVPNWPYATAPRTERGA